MCQPRSRRNAPQSNGCTALLRLGRFDIVDIVEVPDLKQIEKAAMIIRAYGHATTETLLATPWKDFLKGL
jgi:uncharacterized protein with GYD domain